MKTILGLTGLLCLGWAFTLHGQDNWARFRGPDGLGKSQSPHIPIELSKSTTLWEVPTQGHGESSPVIFGKKLFYTVTPEGAPGVRDLVCLSTEDGEELLRKRTKFSEYPSPVQQPRLHFPHRGRRPRLCLVERRRGFPGFCARSRGQGSLEDVPGSF